MPETFLPKALAARSVWPRVLLKIRSADRELNDLELMRARQGVGQTIYINTALPPAVFETVDEEEPGELGAGAAGRPPPRW